MEQEIIEQCKRGNLEEFEKLYDSYFKKIYSFIYYRTGHKETAEDLTSQTFIKALEKIQGFNLGKGTFSAWIYCIARNKVIDHYRTRKSELDISEVWGLGKDPSLDIETRDRIREVKNYLKKIKKEQREIVLMRVWDGLSYKEIAEITGKSETNCKMIFFRTIGKLKEEIVLLLILLSIYG
ncbi:RNA polymerase sigma factor YlaC [subsurface metagenome]